MSPISIVKFIIVNISTNVTMMVISAFEVSYVNTD